MKTIIATIKPHHLGNIRRGKKKYEVRKNVPIFNTPFRVLCCESQSNGQIKAEFICHRYIIGQPNNIEKDILDKCCISEKELIEYAKGNSLFFWEISDMVNYCNTKGCRIRNISEFGLKRAPQSWQYISMEE